MSCGNRFSCGIKRFQQASFAPNRPTNPELHQENENRLAELMRLREQQDKALSFSTPVSTTVTPNQPFLASSDDSHASYTPWVQRSSQ
jgi:hypothetical protein